MPEDRIEINFDDEPEARQPDRLVISADDLAADEPPTRQAVPPWAPPPPSQAPWTPAPVQSWTPARPAASSSARTVLLALAITLPLLLILAGGLYWQYFGRPSAVVRAFNDAMRRKDWQAAAGYLSRDTLAALDDTRRQLIPIYRAGNVLYGGLPGSLSGVTPEKLEKMGPKEFFSVIMDLASMAGQHNVPALTIVSLQERINGSTAAVTVTDASGETETIVLVREGIFWKIDMAATMRMPL